MSRTSTTHSWYSSPTSSFSSTSTTVTSSSSTSSFSTYSSFSLSSPSSPSVPSPLSSSSHFSLPSGDQQHCHQCASTIFNDGIAIIYSYLDTRSWNASAQTSRRWFNIASRSGRCECRAVPYRLKIEPEHSTTFTIPELIQEAEDAVKNTKSTTSKKNVFSRYWTKICTKKSKNLKSTSKTIWSLHEHYIKASDFTCTLDAMPRLVSLLPTQLRVLDLQVNLSAAESKIFDSAVEARSLIFPASLESVSIVSLYSGILPDSIVSFIAAAIHPTASSLTSLTLHTLSPSASLEPICQHPRLQSTLHQLHLSLAPMGCSQTTIASILLMVTQNLLGVTYLTTEVLAPAPSVETHSKPCEVDLMELRNFARLAPLIVSLPQGQALNADSTMNLSVSNGCTQLRSIHFNFEVGLPIRSVPQHCAKNSSLAHHLLQAASASATSPESLTERLESLALEVCQGMSDCRFFA